MNEKGQIEKLNILTNVLTNMIYAISTIIYVIIALNILRNTGNNINEKAFLINISLIIFINYIVYLILQFINYNTSTKYKEDFSALTFTYLLVLILAIFIQPNCAVLIAGSLINLIFLKNKDILK